MKQKISAVILTKNEEDNIVRCLESLKWCNEIILIDDYSDDATVDKSHISCLNFKRKSLTLKVYKRHLVNDFAAQRNFGLTKATSAWILFLDADEILTDQLIYEIKRTVQSKNSRQINGFLIRREDIFRGKKLRFGETSHINLLRLARKNAGFWQGKVHEVWQIEGKVGKLNYPILHLPHPTVSEFLKTINLYSDIVAQDWFEQGKSVTSLEIVFFPLLKFLYNYIILLGFLDKEAGFIMAMMMSFHSFLARGKLWLRLKKGIV